MRVVLASQSPRRRELLERAGVELIIRPADIDERRRPNETPTALVKRLAYEKAAATRAELPAELENEIVVAADTIVWFGDRVLGKPTDDADAAAMLALLSGNTHHVSTGVAVLAPDFERSFVETTEVTFRPLSEHDIATYVATGECADKAGSYAIQGGAAGFVSALTGDYDNVVGLPLTRVTEVLTELDGRP